MSNRTVEPTVIAANRRVDVTTEAGSFLSVPCRSCRWWPCPRRSYLSSSTRPVRVGFCPSATDPRPICSLNCVPMNSRSYVHRVHRASIRPKSPCAQEIRFCIKELRRPASVKPCPSTTLVTFRCPALGLTRSFRLGYPGGQIRPVPSAR